MFERIRLDSGGLGWIRAMIAQRHPSDKLPLLRRQPTAIEEHRAPGEILKRLAERYASTIDSTAEEIPGKNGG